MEAQSSNMGHLALRGTPQNKCDLLCPGTFYTELDLHDYKNIGFAWAGSIIEPFAYLRSWRQRLKMTKEATSKWMLFFTHFSKSVRVITTVDYRPKFLKPACSSWRILNPRNPGFWSKGENRQWMKLGYPVNEVECIIQGEKRISVSKDRIDEDLGPTRWKTPRT